MRLCVSLLRLIIALAWPLLLAVGGRGPAGPASRMQHRPLTRQFSVHGFDDTLLRLRGGGPAEDEDAEKKQKRERKEQRKREKLEKQVHAGSSTTDENGAGEEADAAEAKRREDKEARKKDKKDKARAKKTDAQQQTDDSGISGPRKFLYCEACSVPPEYCAFVGCPSLKPATSKEGEFVCVCVCSFLPQYWSPHVCCDCYSSKRLWFRRIGARPKAPRKAVFSGRTLSSVIRSRPFRDHALSGLL